MALPKHPANNIQLFTNIVKKTEEEVTRNPEKTVIGGVAQFNHYFCTLMGLGITRRIYGDSEHKKFFAKATNIMMMYRLCDIMTWVLCPDDQKTVPQHDKQVFKAPQNTVSIQYPHVVNIVIDVICYSSHSLIFTVSGSWFSMPIAIWQFRKGKMFQHILMCLMRHCQRLSMAFGGSSMDSHRKQMPL